MHKFCTALLIACLMFSVVLIVFGKCKEDIKDDNVNLESETYTEKETETIDIPEPTTTEEYEVETTIEEETTMAKKNILSKEDKELIAIITMAEAEGECEEGKRLVIDTILNRLDSERFPNTVREVIYQPYHFSPIWNGRFDVCYVMDDIYKLVEEELECRTNSDVIFFRTTYYSEYGSPLFQVGNHYFSSY